MSDYKYAIIDSDYILKRNCAAISKGGNGWTEHDLRVSFERSINKMKREIGFEKAILVFDRSPYKKTAVLPAYKGNRVYYTKEWCEEHKDSLSEEEYQNALAQAEFNEKKMHVKYDIIWNPPEGVETLAIKTWEADDLAFILADRLKDKPYKSVVVSIDNDWTSFANDQVDFMTPKYDKREEDIAKFKAQEKVSGIPMYELGILRELYHYSHNAIDVYKSIHPEVKYRDFCESMYYSKNNIPDYETYKKYFDGMNMRKYSDEVEFKLD